MVSCMKSTSPCALHAHIFENFIHNTEPWLELLVDLQECECILNTILGGVLQKCHDHYILQGGEGDCFYVVGSGEFEVLATQVLILVI
jgi:CRP-like cAMP-binding protein